MSFPKVGNLAPAFTLLDQDGKKHSLKDYRGQIVLVYFYPRAMTPGCTVQACALRDSKDALASMNIKVLGISIDAVERLEKFTEKQQLNFTLLSDEDHAVADKYGVWGLKKFMGREFMGVHRMSFIIDQQGRLQLIMVKVNTKTHHQDVMDWVSANL